MLPVIALVGRPNVGKSTLFNRLTRSRDALVADFAGLTRDRQYGQGQLGERDYIVIDTGGIGENEQAIDMAMTEQSMAAIEEADIVFFIVDAKAGLTAADEIIARQLREKGKQCQLVMNKTDAVDPVLAAAEFYSLGLGEAASISASHSKGVRQLIDNALDGVALPEQLQEGDKKEEDAGIKVAIVGRPNVGKSTLVNRLVGEQRVVVYDQSGTTRDSICIPCERHGQRYTLIDTAGVRRRGKVQLTVEKFSIIKTIQAIKDAHVVILVLDAQEGLVDQDLHLLGLVVQTGRSLVIAANKWDGMSQEAKESFKEQLNRKLTFARYVRLRSISALHGTGVGHLYESVGEAYRSAVAHWSPSYLTRILEGAVADHQPPLVHGHRIKLRYCHLGGSFPSVIVVHGSRVHAIPASYRRYLENTFIDTLKLIGTPLRIEFKAGENPYIKNSERRPSDQTRHRRTTASKRADGATAAPRRVARGGKNRATASH